MSSEILSYIVDKINKDSRYYTAKLTSNPKEYQRFVNGRSVQSYCHGIFIHRKPRKFWISSKAFVYGIDLDRLASRIARRDSEFGERLNSISLNSDDVEFLIKKLTFGLIRLGLRGKKIMPKD